jgi:hypothetical protein
MSTAETIKAELTSLCPDFAAAWEDERELWTADDGSFTVHGVFAVFSHYVADRLIRGADPALKKVFDYVESKLTGDDSVVDNAACTCFLENLMNRVPETIPPSQLVPLLGPKSREFCRAWDEWCGMKTEGLS